MTGLLKSLPARSANYRALSWELNETKQRWSRGLRFPKTTAWSKERSTSSNCLKGWGMVEQDSRCCVSASSTPCKKLLEQKQKPGQGSHRMTQFFVCETHSLKNRTGFTSLCEV